MRKENYRLLNTLLCIIVQLEVIKANLALNYVIVDVSSVQNKA